MAALPPFRMTTLLTMTTLLRVASLADIDRDPSKAQINKGKTGIDRALFYS